MKSGYSSSSKHAIFITVVTIVLSACTPDVVPRKFQDIRQDFGPDMSIGELPLDEVKLNSQPIASSILWKGEIESAAWFRASDDLAWLARKMSSPELGQFAYKMYRTLGKGVSWEQTFTGSAYASAAIGETREDTKSAVQSGVEMLKKQDVIIEKLLADRSSNYQWPKERTSLVAVTAHIERFLREFVQDVERSGVDRAVRKELIEELRINFGPKIQRLKAQFALAYNEPKTDQFVAKVRRVLKEEGIDLGKDIGQRLDLAERLPRQVDRIKDPESALAVLVEFWQAATPQTRVSKFKREAPELYDFLDGKSDEDLNCIKTGCGLWTKFKRAVFILPAIENFGVEKIRKQLATAAEETIKSELETEAVKALPGLHKEVFGKISEELSRQRTNISKIASDYGTYMRVVLNRVAIAKLGLKENDVVPAAAPKAVRVDLDVSAAPRILAQRAPTDNRAFHTGAAALGAGMATAIELHDYHLESALSASKTSPIRIKQALGRIFFEQINKVLMIGGFQTETAKAFASFSVAVDGGKGAPERFNLRTLMSSDLTFAVPDAITLAAPSKVEPVVSSIPSKVISASVAGQAELLKGLSRIALSLRDWERSPYDEVLGAINLADFVPDLPRSSVDRKLFPKELFYAASIGNAGALLQNMTKRLSPVALIEPGGGMHWGNEKDPAQDPAQQAIAATVFDVVDGVRSTQSKTADVARFLSAVAEFLRASDGIEKTRAEVLTQVGNDGRPAVDLVIAARKDLKLLVMALANFLSNQTLGEKGIALPVFTRSEENRALGMSGEPTLLDQALVIRALLDAYEVNKAGIYQTAALNLMSSTNDAFYRRSLSFYSDRATDEVPLSLETLAAILVAGERVSAFQTPERAQQWARVSRPWIGALRDAAEVLP